MKDNQGAFNILASIQRHIEALTPLLPKQALVCIGEYPIKTLLKDADGATKEGILPILVEKSSEEIYKWLPKGYSANLVLGFEDAKIDTHFWYNALPTIAEDNSIIESLNKKSIEKLRSAIIFASIWDGIGSAALPNLIEKFRNASMDSLSIAVLPSKIQPTDAHFNAYAAIKQCLTVDGAAVLLLDRDQIEYYEGVTRKGEPLKGNMVANYLLNLFLAKDSLVKEIAELARTFNVKLFTCILVSGASYRIYGSIDNMLNTALLKPMLSFDMSSASLLYVVLRMPATLKDRLSRGRIELAVTNWFKEKTNLKSIYISEPIYTEDMNDRIDAVLFIGGFDTAKMLVDLETKVASLKEKAIECGLLTQDLQIVNIREDFEKPQAPPSKEDVSSNENLAKGVEENANDKPKQLEAEKPASQENVDSEKQERPKAANKPKGVRATRKPELKIKVKKAKGQKEKKTSVA